MTIKKEGARLASILQKIDVRLQIPWVHAVFMKIAEPRVIRILHFGIYVCMMVAGLGVSLHHPAKFLNVVGVTLLIIFGLFVTIGALLSAVAVLPGIWWLERVGIIMLTTSMLMYTVITIAIGSTPVGVAAAIALTLSFAQRWVEIRGAQLAPREV